MTGDRYLPDRRDLNRSFPGSARGSLASRIAHLFMTEVVAKCEVGIDLHTGSDRRSQPPADPGRSRRPAHPRARRGVRRAGHAARQDPRRLAAPRRARAWARRCCSTRPARPCASTTYADRRRRDGVRRVLASLGMIEPLRRSPVVEPSLECRASSWVRARRTGILHLDVELGAEGQRRRAARRALRLLRQDAARGLRRPRRHRHRSHLGADRQLRRRGRPHRQLTALTRSSLTSVARTSTLAS